MSSDSSASTKRHPRELGEADITAFLNDLAANRNVAAGTQNQAPSALPFLYKEVLGQELAWLDGLRVLERIRLRVTDADLC